MTHSVIQVENLSKKYVLRHRQGDRQYKTLRDSLSQGARSLISTLDPRHQRNQRSSKEEFWALKDVSFEVKQGDKVGIIGRNGAGKSTLLKILSQIVKPTAGRIRVQGRMASLLEVGTGFHPELTGRENIFLNGAILGMGKAEIQRKFDEIVAFAEVDKFLDTPVKRYSSGMYVRLAFAVAAHLEPEILIVDEVLAVGDVQFQNKCIGKMQEVGKAGRTILFVSHNLGTLQTLCSRAVLLNQGTVLVDDTAGSAVEHYLQLLEKASSQDLSIRRDRQGKGQIRLTQIEIDSSEHLTTLRTGEAARFIFHITSARPGTSCIFTIFDQYGQPTLNFNSDIRGSDDLTNTELETQLICETDELLLIPGRYRMNVAIMSDGEVQDHVEGATTFEVDQGGRLRGRPIVTGIGNANICMPHRWIVSA
jgi:lipopolysaccharide transport system ATP-binding protein